MSECCDRPVLKSSSDTDLAKIDKDATFAIANPVPPSEILAQVVDALAQTEEICEESGNDELDDLGVQGFSDSEILKSEMFGSGWSLGGKSISSEIYAVPPKILRTRAVSDIRVPNINRPDNSINDWTWSGPAATQKIEEIRAKTKFNRPRARTKSEESQESAKSWLERLRNSFRRRHEQDRKSSESERQHEYIDKTAGGRKSHLSNISRFSTAEERYLARTRSGRASAFSVPESKVLEETSIADLLRALTSLHSRIGAIPEIPTPPQRKLGNAGLVSTPSRVPSTLDIFTPPSNTRLQMRRASVNPALLMPRRKPSLHPLREGELPPPPPYTPGRAALAQRRGSLMPMSTNTFGTGVVHRQIARLRGDQMNDVASRRTRHDSLRDIRIEK